MLVGVIKAANWTISVGHIPEEITRFIGNEILKQMVIQYNTVQDNTGFINFMLNNKRHINCINLFSSNN